MVDTEQYNYGNEALYLLKADKLFEDIYHSNISVPWLSNHER